MKKVLLLICPLLACGVLFVACSDQETTNPAEPSFGKGKPADCNLGDLQQLANYIRDDIQDLFGAKKKPKAANEIFNNVERKVCKELYAAAINTALDFYYMTFNQLPDKLNGDESDAAALVSLVFAFASDPDGPGAPIIPPEALEPTGGVGIVIPGVSDTIWTNNDEAAFVANAGSFGGEGPVTVVLTRLTDPPPGVPGDPIPGYQAYPEAYDFSANVPLVGEAEFWMCVPDAVPVPFDNLVIGHNLGDGESELLTPRLVEDYPGQVLDCTNAEYQPIVVGSAATQGWLRLAGTILEPIVSSVLDVKSLNAMYFAGRGLGGRGNSFSDFAPVDLESNIPDPVIEFVGSELNLEDPLNPGTYFNRYNFTTTNWAHYAPSLFEITDAYGPCGGNAFPSRTWLEIYDASDDSNIYGFCAFDSPDDLQSFWFSTPAGQGPPDIYIELWDKATDETYGSNTVGVPIVWNTLTVQGAGSGSGSMTHVGYLDNCLYDGGVTTGTCEATTVDWVWFEVTATADPGSIFVDWSGACTGTGSCLVPMDADKTATATFSMTGPM